MLYLYILLQKVNYRNFFSSQYDNRLPLESVQLWTTKTFVDMWLIKYSLWPYTTFLKTKSFWWFPIRILHTKPITTISREIECLLMCCIPSFAQQNNKESIYLFINRTHYLHIYSYQYRNECTNETKEDYCFNYCYGQTSGALTTLALENNCTHWNS